MGQLSMLFDLCYYYNIAAAIYLAPRRGKKRRRQSAAHAAHSLEWLDHSYNKDTQLVESDPQIVGA